VEFSTYATPTIVGEIKRHFRDKGWAIRVPRRLQELKLSLTKATSELSQKNGRSPTVAELAQHLGMTEEEILEGLESANAYSAVSLDAPDGGDDDSPAVADSLGMMDDALEGVEYRESLKPLLEQLPPREKKILMLRFFGNMTQSQIAGRARHQPDARLPAARPHARPAAHAPARRGVAVSRGRGRPAAPRAWPAGRAPRRRAAAPGTAAYQTCPCTRPTPTGSASSCSTTAGERDQPATRRSPRATSSTRTPASTVKRGLQQGRRAVERARRATPATPYPEPEQPSAAPSTATSSGGAGHGRVTVGEASGG
jgi:RNA polymerase sigma factor (sigma-70 family)